MCAKLLQSCLTLCDPVDCRPLGSPVHEISQVRILEGVANPFSRGCSWQGRYLGLLLCRQILYCWATREAHRQVTMLIRVMNVNVYRERYIHIKCLQLTYDIWLTEQAHIGWNGSVPSIAWEWPQRFNPLFLFHQSKNLSRSLLWTPKFDIWLPGGCITSWSTVSLFIRWIRWIIVHFVLIKDSCLIYLSVYSHQSSSPLW